MFTNERLFTIQAFTITRVHCIHNYILCMVRIFMNQTLAHNWQFSVQQGFALWNCFIVWYFLIFEAVKLCRMKNYIGISNDAGSIAWYNSYTLRSRIIICGTDLCNLCRFKPNKNWIEPSWCHKKLGFAPIALITSRLTSCQISESYR